MRAIEIKKHRRNHLRLAIATTLIVTVIVILVLIGGIGAYYLTAGKTTSPIKIPSTSQTSNIHSTSALGASISTSTTSNRVTLATSSTGRTSIGSSGVSTYNGTFSYSVPIGPTGERVLSNNTVQSYRSVQEASGSFKFTISPTTSSGSGSGQGTLIVTTSGFSSGSTTVPYTFKITDATTHLGGNLTVFFGTHTPSQFTVPLSCTGSITSVDTSVNNPAQFLAEYPGEISAAGVPVTVNQQLLGNITYNYSIVKTS